MAWETFVEMKENRTVISGKIGGIVKGGAIMYVDGVRAFIPASKLDLKFVEDVNPYLGKEVEAIVITADEENNKLVLSVRDVLLDKKRAEKEAAKAGVVQDILLEINVAQEESKWGFPLEDAAEAVKQVSQLSHVRVKGLMTSAPYTENPEDNRLYFRALRSCFDSIREMSLPNVSMEVLSMGMTGDYEVAIEEGSTLVRVGTGIFGERNYH